MSRILDRFRAKSTAVEPRCTNASLRITPSRSTRSGVPVRSSRPAVGVPGGGGPAAGPRVLLRTNSDSMLVCSPGEMVPPDRPSVYVDMPLSVSMANKLNYLCEAEAGQRRTSRLSRRPSEPIIKTPSEPLSRATIRVSSPSKRSTSGHGSPLVPGGSRCGSPEPLTLGSSCSTTPDPRMSSRASLDSSGSGGTYQSEPRRCTINAESKDSVVDVRSSSVVHDYIDPTGRFKVVTTTTVTTVVTAL